MKKNLILLSMFFITCASFAQVYEGYPYNPEKPGTPGEAWAVPGVIYAVYFDEGGSEIAYHDKSNLKGNDNFRKEHVGIENCALSENGISKDVCRNNGGDWLKYTVSVENTGKYNVYFTLAQGDYPGKFSLSVDGVDVSGAVISPMTAEGNWQTWLSDVVIPDVEMTEGEHVLTFHVIDGGFNFFKMEFVTAVSGSAIPGVSSAKGKVWVENGKLHTSGYSAGAAVEIYNVFGQRTTQFSPGIYLIKVRMQEKTTIHKVLVK